MVTKIELTPDEAQEAVTKAVALTGGNFLIFTPAQRIAAILGAVKLVDALQVLGYTITKPSKGF